MIEIEIQVPVKITIEEELLKSANISREEIESILKEYAERYNRMFSLFVTSIIRTLLLRRTLTVEKPPEKEQQKKQQLIRKTGRLKDYFGEIVGELFLKDSKIMIKFYYEKVARKIRTLHKTLVMGSKTFVLSTRKVSENEYEVSFSNVGRGELEKIMKQLEKKKLIILEYVTFRECRLATVMS